MMTKCSNLNCVIVKVYKQVCITQALDKDLTNKSGKFLEYYEPKQAKDGCYYCSQFDG